MCCSSVMSTSQPLTMRYGTPYSAKTRAAPAARAAARSAAQAASSPASLSATSARSRALKMGAHGQKWFTRPGGYLRPAALMARYSGQPTVSVMRMCSARPGAVFSHGPPGSSARFGGTKTSSRSRLPVPAWCRRWLNFQLKYGTSSALCATKPTASFTSAYSEKAPWPHSCATTQMPVHTAPCATQ